MRCLYLCCSALVVPHLYLFEESKDNDVDVCLLTNQAAVAALALSCVHYAPDQCRCPMPDNPPFASTEYYHATRNIYRNHLENLKRYYQQHTRVSYSRTYMIYTLVPLQMCNFCMYEYIVIYGACVSADLDPRGFGSPRIWIPADLDPSSKNASGFG